MNAISRTRITGITTIITALLVVVSAVGLTFAEEAPQATVQIIPETTPAITPETTPEASMPFGPRQKTPLVTRIASILNMNEEDLSAARHEGKSFIQIAEGKGISEAQLIDTLTIDFKAFLDSQASQGKLTSEQVATTIAEMEENLKIALSRTEVGPPETRPNIGRNIGRNTGGENTPCMPRAHGKADGGRHGSMSGFSQGVQAGRREGLGRGPGLGRGQGQAQGQSQGQGICPCCGRALQPSES